MPGVKLKTIKYTVIHYQTIKYSFTIKQNKTIANKNNIMSVYL